VSYLTNFLIYASAMVGVFMIAVFVFKKSIHANPKSKSNNSLSVEEVITLAPRKNLYIIKAGSEKFLIAVDSDRTSLISKLNDSPTRQNRFMNLQDFTDNSLDNFSPKEPVMKELMKKLNV